MMTMMIRSCNILKRFIFRDFGEITRSSSSGLLLFGHHQPTRFLARIASRQQRPLFVQPFFGPRLYCPLKPFSTFDMNNSNQAKNIWRKANAVCFDVDSTVIQDEAIDELAKFCGKGDEVQELTMQAMKGGMDFRQALAIRLDLIRPTATQLRNFIHSQKSRLSPYVKELIHELQKRDKEVFLISGGFRSIIEPLARDLNIPTANVYANKLKFYHDGEYAGFDKNQLTSRSGGKGAAIRDLKEKFGYETVVMVGDGITDWEASPPADLFIGFGGNAYRPEVKAKSKWYVTDFRDLINEMRD